MTPEQHIKEAEAWLKVLSEWSAEDKLQHMQAAIAHSLLAIAKMGMLPRLVGSVSEKDIPILPGTIMSIHRERRPVAVGWNPKDVPPGIYDARVEYDENTNRVNLKFDLESRRDP